MEPWGIFTVVLVGLGTAASIEEAILEEGDPVFVLGQASLAVDQRGQRETSRRQPMLRVITGSDRRPTVIADEHAPGDLALAR
jgi:hypothetical protein